MPIPAIVGGIIFVAGVATDVLYFSQEPVGSAEAKRTKLEEFKGKKDKNKYTKQSLILANSKSTDIGKMKEGKNIAWKRYQKLGSTEAELKKAPLKVAYWDDKTKAYGAFKFADDKPVPQPKRK